MHDTPCARRDTYMLHRCRSVWSLEICLPRVSMTLQKLVNDPNILGIDPIFPRSWRLQVFRRFPKHAPATGEVRVCRRVVLLRGARNVARVFSNHMGVCLKTRAPKCLVSLVCLRPMAPLKNRHFCQCLQLELGWFMEPTRAPSCFNRQIISRWLHMGVV